ncbi:MAG: hypothetical protein EON92_07385 [Burkholderiales bacterium]|nr:MAG: hypothetical protein EON92_07385 [Burkholderiales bacterium]
MAEPIQQPIPLYASPALAAVQTVDDAASDIALGFECANPWLQIERWGQEGASSSAALYA